MQTLHKICDFLDNFAPTELAEDWDNVGLLVGDAEANVNKIMTCLTITPESADEAIQKEADLIVTHHPLPFRPLKRITTDKTSTKLLWNLIRKGIAIYSPHTGFDSALNGINQSVCNRLSLANIRPLIPNECANNGNVGAGRIGELKNETTVQDFLRAIKQSYSIEQIRYVGKAQSKCKLIASACGSGGSFLAKAIAAGCDTLITGEADFHSCLEASAQNVNLILLGHYASERFAVEMLADRLSEVFNDLEIWASDQESDPIVWA